MVRVLLALSLSLIAAPGHAYLSQNNQRVEGAQGGFEVLASPGQGASVSWCAAGDFVIHGLGLPGSTRFWRVTPPPRKAGQGVGFSLDPAAAQKSGLIRFGAVDEGMSASAAQELCPRDFIAIPQR